MAERIVTRPWVRPRKRVRDVAVVARYHAIRAGLLCEYCGRAPGVELNHILHGSKKEDQPFNFHLVCRPCHQDPVFGFHGHTPRWTVERALRAKLAQGFALPQVAWAYLEGWDQWPGTVQSIEEQFRLVEGLADQERRR